MINLEDIAREDNLGSFSCTRDDGFNFVSEFCASS